MFARLSYALALLLCLALPPAAHAEWTLTTVDGPDLPKITINQWSLTEGLSYTGPNANLGKCDTRQIVELRNMNPAPPISTTRTPAAADEYVSPSAPPTIKPTLKPAAGRPTTPKTTPKWKLLLRSGDVLYATTLTTDPKSPDTLILRTPEIARLEIPLKRIAALLATDLNALPLPTNSDKDTLLFRSGDTLTGILTSLHADSLTMQSDLGDTNVKLSNLARLTLGGAKPARTLPPLSVRLTFDSGSVLTTTKFNWVLGKITCTDPAGQECSFSPEEVRSILLLGGRILWLTEIEPTTEEQSTLLNTRWPMRLNQNVTGGPLSIAQQIFTRGLGVHTRSVLTYELDGTYTNLTLRCGLDDSSAPYGLANLTISVDDKIIWQAKNMKPGQISEPLNLPLNHGKKLELRADPADNLDIRGRVNWVNVALTRPPPP